MSKHLLVIEDDTDLAQVIADLARLEGYSAATVSDKKDIEETLRSSQPDVIVLDILMPEMDGHEVLSFLSEQNSTAKIIIITGQPVYLNGATVLGQGLGLNIVGSMHKPLDMDEMRERIVSLVRQAA